MPDSRIFVRLLRINQWYKNIIIFLPLVFSLQLFLYESVLFSVLGFIALCFVSSAGYIRNDIKDIESDKLHPTKKERPLPSEKITNQQATILSIVFFASGLSLSFFLDWKFGIMAILLLANTELYSNWIKKILFLDILSIGGNFIIRAISGIILVDSPLSPWLILGIFFVALFLAALKRRNELIVFKELAKTHKNFLPKYNKNILNSIILITSVLILATYSLYSMNSITQDWRLINTVPIVTYVVFRQIHLSFKTQEKIVSDIIWKDKPTSIAIVAYSIITFYLLYYSPAEFFGS